MAFLIPAVAAAETPTLDDLLNRLDADPSISTAAEALALERGHRAELETKFPGPDLDADGRLIPGGEHEIEVSIGQTFPLGGARRARREAMLAEAAALRSDGSQTVLQLQSQLATGFYEAVHRQERLVSFAIRQQAVERAHASLTRREQAGDASAYEVERMGRELRRVNLQIQREQLELKAALARAAALVDAAPFDGVAGDLAPAQCGGAMSAAPRIAALEHRIEASVLEGKAARSTWVPSLSARVGWAGVLADGSLAPGVLGGIGLSFPFWGYGDSATDAAASRTAGLRAERDVLDRSTKRIAAEFEAQCTAHLSLAKTAEAGIAGSSQLLERAEAGYAAAELSLLELVDAQTALLEDRLEHLALLAAAREAQNGWMQVTGGWQ